MSGHRRKERKSKAPSFEAEVQAAEDYIAKIDLKSLGPKKVIEIIFLSTSTQQSYDDLKKVISIATEYEDLARTTFISYQDVIDFFMDDETEVVLPTPFPIFAKMLTERLRSIIRNGQQPYPYLIASLSKLNLLNIMYENFLNDIDCIAKRKRLDSTLRILTKECIKGNKAKVPVDLKKQSLQDTRSLRKSELKVSTSNTNIFMYPKEFEEAEELVFDDDISNHVWFFVFYNFEDITILQNLITFHNLPIGSIINVNINESEENKTDRAVDFWQQIFERFDGPKRESYFANTILMKFSSSGDDYKQILEELLYVIKTILEIKLQHLHYIRHIQLIRIKRQYNHLPAYCMDIYNQMCDSLPFEMLTKEIIVSNMLEEINSKLQNTSSKTSYLDLVSEIKSGHTSETKLHCPNPCSPTSEVKHVEMPIKHLKTSVNFKNYLIHEVNVNSALQLNGYVGTAIRQLIKKMRMCSNSFSTLKQEYEFDFIHHHDRNPSDIVNRIPSEESLHLMYIFLFSIITDGSDNVDNCKELELEDLMENLYLYDDCKFRKQSQISIITESTTDDSTTDTVKNAAEDTVNFYDPIIMQYMWKETLSSDALVEEITQAEKDYLYLTKRYCTETNTSLLLFSSHLDQFGINTKFFQETLNVPICLRDFCKYIMVEKNEWLKNNKPPRYVRKFEAMEDCPGYKRIQSMPLFSDYKYLLEPKILSEPEGEEINEDGDDSISFEDMINELEKYPLNSKFYTEYEKIPPYLLAHDFGTQYVAVRGAITNFVSHDGVSIKVDNTRFVTEKPKCSVVLNYKNTDFVFHSNSCFLNNDYNFHINTNEGTMISFAIRNSSRKKPNSRKSFPEEQLDTQIIMEEEKSAEQKDEELDFILKNIQETKVISINKETFETVYTDVDLSSVPSKFEADKLLRDLQNVADEPFEAFKINSNLKYLKLKPTIKIPFINILRRIIPKSSNVVEPPKLQERSTSRQYFAPDASIDQLHENGHINYKITAPNGLHISLFNITRRKEIKQEFLKSLKSPIKDEEFRLFTREGYILIKRTDGSIVIMQSNGDQLFYEKPDDADMDIRLPNLRTCRCKTIEDYRKKVNRLLDTKDDLYFSSRRAHLRSKKGYVIDRRVLQVLDGYKIPYKKISVLNFEGHKTCLQGNRINQRLIHHTTQEHDFFKEELYFERSDGLQMLFDKQGKQTLSYPDGSKIICTAHVQPELVDGFVFVITSFRYEHPLYATVIYDSEGCLLVKMNDIELKNTKRELILRTGTDDITNINTDSVVFNKSCSKCEGCFTCTFNIKPFVENSLNFEEQFIHAEDSYNKHFYSNFKGDCSRNINFLNGLCNKFNCDHVHDRIYKKLFVVNSNYTGEQFWTDEMMESKITLVEKDEDCETELSYDGDRELVKFKKKIYYPTVSKICLSKYAETNDKKLAYIAFRNLQKMVNLPMLTKFIGDLKTCLQTSKCKSIEARFIDKITNVQSKLKDIELTERHKSLSIINSPEEIQKCKCIQIRKTMKDKTDEWREEYTKYLQLVKTRAIPNYFKSQFCQISS